MKPLRFILPLVLLVLGSGCEQRIRGELRVEAEAKRGESDCFTLPSELTYKTWGQLTKAERLDRFGTSFAIETILSDATWASISDSLRPTGVELGDARRWRNRHFRVLGGTVLPEEPRDSAGRLQIEFQGIERAVAQRVVVALEQDYRSRLFRAMPDLLHERIFRLRTEAAEIARKLTRSDLPPADREFLNKLLSAINEHLAETEHEARRLTLTRDLKSASLY